MICDCIPFFDNALLIAWIAASEAVLFLKPFVTTKEFFASFFGAIAGAAAILVWEYHRGMLARVGFLNAASSYAVSCLTIATNMKRQHTQAIKSELTALIQQFDTRSSPNFVFDHTAKTILNPSFPTRFELSGMFELSAYMPNIIINIDELMRTVCVLESISEARNVLIKEIQMMNLAPDVRVPYLLGKEIPGRMADTTFVDINDAIVNQSDTVLFFAHHVVTPTIEKAINRALPKFPVNYRKKTIVFKFSDEALGNLMPSRDFLAGWVDQ